MTGFPEKEAKAPKRVSHTTSNATMPKNCTAKSAFLLSPHAAKQIFFCVVAVCFLSPRTIQAQTPLNPGAPHAVLFPAIEAASVRLVILRSLAGEPCIDELEVFGPESPTKNLAGADNGARAAASSCLTANDYHKIEYLNDGKYGVASSWIPAKGSESWAQIDLPRKAFIDRVVFSRDRLRRTGGRWIAAFEVRISQDGKAWTTVAKGNYINKPPFGAINGDAAYTRGATWEETLRLSGEKLGEMLDDLVVPVLKKELGHNYDWFHANVFGSPWWNPEMTVWFHEKPIVDARLAMFSAGMESLWVKVSRDFPEHDDRVAQARERRDDIWRQAWKPGNFQELAFRYAKAVEEPRKAAALAMAEKTATLGDLEALRRFYIFDNQSREILAALPFRFNPSALRRAIRDLSTNHPAQFTRGVEFLAQLDQIEKLLPALSADLAKGDAAQMAEGFRTWKSLLAFQREVLLLNPLLDFDEILFIRHTVPSGNSGKIHYADWLYSYNLPYNWSGEFQGPPIAPRWNAELCKTSLRRTEKPHVVVFKPKPGHDLKHLELDYDGEKMLFDMAGSHNRWQVHEIMMNGTGLRQVNRGKERDVDNGDACYLPDGRIVFNSNRGFIGVPCHNGITFVTNLCMMNADGTGERMLCFDQESNFHPSVLNNGRILFLRYEYANVSHQYPGLLFHMNPDGTGQIEYYGSNSYWPNRVFYPRAIPGHPTMVAGIVTGHHAPHRTGKLILFDPAKGRFEADGVVQAIPGHGKAVEPVVVDGLYAGDWPKFLHPYPLSEKYFLVSGMLSASSTFCIWLVDVFDNMVLLKEIPGNALFDPIPIRQRPRPLVIPDKIKPDEETAAVYLQDVYHGKPMEGVPRGTVKNLRIFSYNYVYRHRIRDQYGHLATPGIDGPWEPRYLLGTVPVADDGSAFFRVPANTPVSVQPLDGEGRAVQQMRSWFTGMPGEIVSCVGCHDSQNTAPPNKATLAIRSRPVKIEPWHGPARGFDFEREVQPVLDQFCIGCHSSSASNGIDLTRKTPAQKRVLSRKFASDTESNIVTVFTPSYLALQSRVYRSFAEGQYGPQVPYEFYADISPLIRMLKKGHYNVCLDSEAWKRLYTWIDLAAPDHGTWTRFSSESLSGNRIEHRKKVMAAYAGLDYDFEKLPPEDDNIINYVEPAPLPATSQPKDCSDWPFDAATAKMKQAGVGLPVTRKINLGQEINLDFVLIPPGEFIMGNREGADDERNIRRVAIEKPFYMSVREISNEELRTLQPDHNSGRIGYYSIDWRGDGYDANESKQPAVRVSWLQAMSFCQTLSEKSGCRIGLPTEAQWEWACRAGTASPMWYGAVTDAFSTFENLADSSLRRLAFGGKSKWFLRDDNSYDKGLVAVATGSYLSNPWGLFDMHGNVSEWTHSEYKPYPYHEDDGRNETTQNGLKVVRGGSWWDLPQNAASAYRWRFHPWQKVYNVGFRVVMAAEQPADLETVAADHAMLNQPSVRKLPDSR